MASRSFRRSGRTEPRAKRYPSMEWSWTPLKTFTQSRPVLYGVPLAAMIGVVLGLVFRVGAQLETTEPSEPFSRVAVGDTAVPITWPSGKVPDYVVGTDFLAATRQPDPIVADTGYYEPSFVPLPTPVAESSPPVVIAPRPARDEAHWASTEGDILDIRLTEDRPEIPAPD